MEFAAPARLRSHRPAQLAQMRNLSGQSGWALVQPNLPPVLMDEACAAIFSHFDGRRTSRECAVAAGIREQQEVLIGLVDRFFKVVWRCGFGTIKLPPGSS